MHARSLQVVVEQPFDWVGSVFVPVVAVLVSAGIAISVAAAERRAARRDRIRAQTTNLIRALNAIGRASLPFDPDELNVANARYEQELNALGAQLGKRDVVVAKFVCIVVNKADNEPVEYQCRTMLWVASALELWLRGTLSSVDFARNMPSDTSSWVEHVNLGEWRSVLRGQPVEGIGDLHAFDRD